YPGALPPTDVEPDPPSYAPVRELGATYVATRPQEPPRAMGIPRRVRIDTPNAMPVRPVGIVARLRSNGRVLALIVSAGVLFLGAILFAVLWPRVPPISASPRVDSAGHEVLAIECPKCPDGTKLAMGDSTATVAAHVAELPMTTPLPVGESVVQIGV